MRKEFAAPNGNHLRVSYLWVCALLATPTLAQRPPDCSTIRPTIEGGRIVELNQQECVLRAGDVFSVAVEGIESRDQIVISSIGTFKAPLMGEILADGLTLSELEHSMDQKLLSYIKNPHVGVSYDPSVRLKTYKVVGSVGRAGTYIATPNLKLSEALQSTAVLTSHKKSTVKIVRATGFIYKSKSLNADTDILIEPADSMAVY